MPEITSEDERVEVSALQNTFNIFASIVGIGLSFALGGFLAEEGLLGFGGTLLLILVFTFSTIEMIVFIPTILTIPEKPVQRKERDLIREIKIVLQNKNYVLWFTGQGIFSIGLILVTTLAMDFIKDVLQFDEPIKFILFGASLLGTMILAFPFWIHVARKWGKKRALITGLIWLVAILPLTRIIGNLDFIDVDIQGYIFGVLVAIGLSAYYLFPYAIIADIADKDERDTTENRAGMYTGFVSVP